MLGGSTLTGDPFTGDILADSPRPFAAVTGAVDRLVDAMAHTSWLGKPDDDVLDALRAATTLQKRVDAMVGTIALAAEQGPVQRAGSRNAPIWVGAHTGHAPADTRADLRIARWILDFGDFRTAWLEGVLSRRHIDRLRSADTPVTHFALRRDQQMLVQFARDLSLADFTVAVQYWVNAVDPDGIIPETQVKGNRLRVRRRSDGSGTIEGELDPLLMTVIHEGLAREEKKLRDADSKAGVERTNSQRRAAALAGLVARGAARGDATMGSPLINLVMSQQVAEQLLRWRASRDTNAGQDPDGSAGRPTSEPAIEVDFGDIDGRCELIDGTPIHPKLAGRLLGVAELRRMVLDARSRPLDVSHKARSFPQWMRDAALVTTRGRCSELGCDADFHWLHADHIRPVAKGGETRADNVSPLCSTANRAKGASWPTKPAA